MSDPIHSILQRLALIEGKTTPAAVQHGLNPQQKSVPQLPALFRPKDISPVLKSKKDPKHPMSGYMVGDSVEPKMSSLAETMQSVEEDMLGKVKRDFVDYLERLEDENKVDRDLIRKAKKEIEQDNPTEQAQEPEAEPIADSYEMPQAMAESPVKTVALEDGTMLEIYGDQGRGFEIRNQGRSLPTRFPNIDHADMAVKLFQKRRAKQDNGQDYIEEK